MSIFEHSRLAIFNVGQHPYKHALSEFQYSNPAFGGEVTNAQQALDWVLAVLYPQHQDSVATVAALPSSGNTLNDYRVVEDDGDGKPAGYRWEQREGEVSASWHKVYDFDWSTDSIIAAYLNHTQDMYVAKAGRDDRDASGNVLGGVQAGQSVYGGASASTHLTLLANAGDGTGSGTGYVQFGDNARPTVSASFSLGTASLKFLDGYFSGSGHFGTLTIGSGSVSDSSGLIDLGLTNLTTAGYLDAGTVKVSSGSIICTTGTIDFDNEHLTTTGDLTANKVTATGAVSTFKSGTAVGHLTLADGSITDSSGAISFNDENLSTTGSVTGGQVNADNVRLDGNSVSSTSGNLNISSVGTVDIQTAMTTVGQTLTGTLAVTGQLNADNLRLDGDTLSTTDTNGNLVLSPNGTGTVQTSAKVVPTTDAAKDLGDTTHRFQNAYLSGSIGDGTNTIGMTALMSLRNVATTVTSGDSLFWDGSKWVASAPDTEIAHASINGLTTGDAGHTQFTMLAGRAGGQTVQGGTASGENLTLESTSNITKGAILLKGVTKPQADNTYDLGATALAFKDLYLKGEAKGLRFENYTTVGRPTASASTPGRVIWDTTLSAVYADIGGSWTKVGAEKAYVQDASGWTGAVSTVTYTVDGTSGAVTGKVTDSRLCNWTLKDNSNNYKQILCDIDFPSATQVRVTVGEPLAAGTYTLVGVG